MIFCQNLVGEVFAVDNEEHVETAQVEDALEGQVGLAGIDRMQLGKRYSIPGRRGHGTQVDVGVTEQQAQELFAYRVGKLAAAVNTYFYHNII